ncbi:hypothetical protein ACB092_11G134700 [Castanea dentata]
MATNDVNLNNERTKLYLAALKGDWKSVKDMTGIQREISKKKETTLHIAAAANQEEFVNKLLTSMTSRNGNLTAINNVGNTALTYAAAAGNVNIAKAMLKRNSDELPNLGHSRMVDWLYSETKQMVHGWDVSEQAKLFITCVTRDLYGVALKMLRANLNLATATNSDGETALRVLARNPSAFTRESQLGKLLRGHINIPYEISQLLFVATEVGNVEFLVKLIHFDVDLLWKTQNNKSIFCIAVEKRHERIFNLINEIGSIGYLLIDQVEDGTNILHLAAGLAPQEKLNAITGAALQMQRELLWFKEVEKVVRPAFKEMVNGKGETPYALFARTHEELRTKGEKWMMDTAEYSMLVATLICSIMFSVQPADGSNRTANLAMVFSVSNAVALFSSSTSLVMFLSILTSRYSYDDFLVRLPVRLMFGVTSLGISIAAMMVSFSISFWLKNFKHKELPLIFVFIGLFACVSILYVLLKCRLFVDIVRSTLFRFKPCERLLYKEVSHEQRIRKLKIA